MPSIACMARCAPAESEPPRYFVSAVGTICQRHAVAVLQPAALFGLAAVRQQRIPEPIDLGLIGAVDLEGDGVRVFHLHAAVQRHEALAGQRELDHQHGAGLAAGAVDGVALDLLDPESGSSET